MPRGGWFTYDVDLILLGGWYNFGRGRRYFLRSHWVGMGGILHQTLNIGTKPTTWRMVPLRWSNYKYDTTWRMALVRRWSCSTACLPSRDRWYFAWRMVPLRWSYYEYDTTWRMVRWLLWLNSVCFKYDITNWTMVWLCQRKASFLACSPSRDGWYLASKAKYWHETYDLEDGFLTNFTIVGALFFLVTTR
jgi:hypothetical protein